MNYSIFFLSILFLISCTPTLKTTSKSTLPSISPLESFAFIKEDTVDFKNSIGILATTNSFKGAFNCSYDTLKKLLIVESRANGANCFVVTKHKEPDALNLCHRIKGKMYHIENAHDYETEIIWQAQRRLKIRDFKGTLEKRPFQAATMSSFRYRYQVSALTGKLVVEVETFFDCSNSYFKPSEQDSAILAHEQIHFDISELYARRFLKKVKSEITTNKEFLSQHGQLYKSTFDKMVLKQDEYDTEVYADRTKQIKWQKWIKTELEKYKDSKELRF